MPQFKTRLQGAGYLARKSTMENVEVQEAKHYHGRLYENPEFKHVYQAMRMASKELEEAVFKNHQVFLDAAPIDYEEYHANGDQWLLLS